MNFNFTPLRERNKITRSFKYGLAIVLCLTGTLTSATSFSSFIEYENPGNSLIRGDGYPGQMKILNYRTEPVCLYFRYKNDQGEVLRLSKIGNKIPANRQDLTVKGPGVNARSLEVAVNHGNNQCGQLQETDNRPMLVIRAGEFKNSNGFDVDARTWSGSSRDITINIR